MEPVNDINDPISWVPPYDLEMHKAQRAERGFSEYDWWNFSEYIAWVMWQALDKFQKEAHGYPMAFSKEHGDGTGIDGWENALQQMKDAFEAQSKINDLSYFNKDDLEGSDKRLSELKKTWEIGMQLFTKYFGCLWD